MRINQIIDIVESNNRFPEYADDDENVIDRKVQSAKPKVEPPPMYNVFIFNDPTTHAIFVSDLLEKHFHIKGDRAWNIMMQAHKEGMALVVVMPKEIAETKVHLAMQEARAAQHPNFYMSAEPKD